MTYARFPYKAKKLNFSKHRYVAYHNDRIEILITNILPIEKYYGCPQSSTMDPHRVVLWMSIEQYYRCPWSNNMDDVLSMEQNHSKIKQFYNNLMYPVEQYHDGRQFYYIYEEIPQKLCHGVVLWQMLLSEPNSFLFCNVNVYFLVNYVWYFLIDELYHLKQTTHESLNYF